MDFLVKELKVCTTKQAEERVFFVSARETLQVNMKEMVHDREILISFLSVLI